MHVCGVKGGGPPDLSAAFGVIYACCTHYGVIERAEGYYSLITVKPFNNNNNRRLVTLAEHTSDHGRQTNSSHLNRCK